VIPDRLGAGPASEKDRVWAERVASISSKIAARELGSRGQLESWHSVVDTLGVSVVLEDVHVFFRFPRQG